MAQGQPKRSSKPSPTTTKKSQSLGRTTKRGARVVKPKKGKLLEQRKVIKKHTAALTAKTERTLAQRAGHLELLKGGKKDEKEVKAKGKKVEIRKKD